MDYNLLCNIMCVAIVAMLIWNFGVRKYLFTEKCELYKADLTPIPNSGQTYGHSLYAIELNGVLGDSKPLLEIHVLDARTHKTLALFLPKNDTNVRILGCVDDATPHFAVSYDRMYWRHIFGGKRKYAKGPTKYTYEVYLPVNEAKRLRVC